MQPPDGGRELRGGLIALVMWTLFGLQTGSAPD
jgi:hypothetical protein